MRRGRVASTGTAPTPALVGETTLFFTYGYKDFAVTDVLEAISLYEGEGIPVDVKVVPRPAKKAAATAATSGASYDRIGRVQEVWARYLGE